MTDDLKPCPFCGGAAHMEENKQGRHYFEAGCARCDFGLDMPTEEEAVRFWNRRADDQPITFGR